MGKAFMQGMAIGFLKSNNNRREQMQQRFQELAANNATMARERAKSRYDTALKGANEEEQRFQALRAEGMVDTEGKYTDVYWQDKARSNWLEEKSPMTLEQYAQTYKQGRGDAFIRNYKSPQELQKDLTNLYQGINAREYEEVGKQALTGFDQLLGRGVVGVQNMAADAFNSGAEAIGVDAEMSKVDPSVIEGNQPTPANVGISAMPEVRAGQSEITVNEDQGLDYQYARDPKELETTYKTYNEDGSEHIVKVWKDGTVETEATGLTKEGAKGTVEMKLADLKNPVDVKITERIRDGLEAQRLIGEIIEDTSVETSAQLPKLSASIIQRIQDEFTGTFGSDEEKRTATLNAIAAAYSSELTEINAGLPEDQRLKPTQRAELLNKVGKLEQNKRALAYALVRLNRASGRFSAQELNEQLDLLASDNMPKALARISAAQKQVRASLDRDIQEAVASVVTTHLVAQGDRSKNKNMILGTMEGTPAYDPKARSYYVDFREGPYEFAYMTANGGVELVPRLKIN